MKELLTKSQQTCLNFFTRLGKLFGDEAFQEKVLNCVIEELSEDNSTRTIELFLDRFEVIEADGDSPFNIARSRSIDEPEFGLTDLTDDEFRHLLRHGSIGVDGSGFKQAAKKVDPQTPSASFKDIDDDDFIRSIGSPSNSVL